jgi:hypothetical protein
MSRAVERHEAKLAELESERDALGSVLTRDEAERKARDYGLAVRRDEVAALVLNGHAHGQPLQRVLNAYTASGSPLPFDEWAIETVLALDGITVTDKQRDSRLRKLGASISAVEKDLLAARKAAAMEALEKQFAGEAA